MAELFFVLGSKFAEATRAVSVRIVPLAAVTWTVRVSVMLVALAREEAVHVTLPVPPSGGAVQLPTLVVTLTKVVPVGVLSVTETVEAASGPLLVVVIV